MQQYHHKQYLHIPTKEGVVTSRLCTSRTQPRANKRLHTPAHAQLMPSCCSGSVRAGCDRQKVLLLLLLTNVHLLWMYPITYVCLFFTG